MKKRYLFIVLMVCLAVMNGCKKQELDIDLTEVNAGDLNIKVTDNNGNGLADVTVYITNGSLSSILDEKVTDNNGNANFSELLYGTYYLIIESVIIEGMDYYVERAVQVVNGGSKDYNIVPSDYVGSVTIDVTDWFDDPVPDIHVSIFDNKDVYDQTFDGIMKLVVQSAVTDTNGRTEFTGVPFGSYGVMIYEDSVNYNINNYVFSIEDKNQEVHLHLYYNN